ncbi:MAG: hypothetical protein HYX32_11785 [Actinobacteria bacterium]|nr:hypothetical protein [Actinomycetota bacterium]
MAGVPRSRLIRLEDPFGAVLVLTEYDLSDTEQELVVVKDYTAGHRVSVVLKYLPDDDRQAVLDDLDRMVSTDRGELWEFEPNTFLLTPRHPTSSGEGPGSGPSGDREPRVPNRPLMSGAAALPLPDDTQSARYSGRKL